MKEDKNIWMGGKIRKLMKEGYKDPKQRVAIALNMARDRGYDIPESKKKGK